MTEQRNFTNEIAKLYPPPEKPSRTFTPEDVSALENALGIEFPSDYIDFLKLYGHGSFENYVYINYPFGENAPENFIAETERRRENYRMLEKTRIEAETFPGDKPVLWVDCIFQGGELAVTGGNPDMAVYLRTERIDKRTRSRIIALGDHFPYKFYPEKGGLIFMGYTDDDEFFIRYSEEKMSVVLYGDLYYEFDMSFTEFLYEYLTEGLKLPMFGGNTEWTFIPYE